MTGPPVGAGSAWAALGDSNYATLSGTYQNPVICKYRSTNREICQADALKRPPDMHTRTLDELSLQILRAIHGHAVRIGGFVDAPNFRVDHKEWRPLLDRLEQSQYLKREEDQYRITFAALMALDDNESRITLGDCAEIFTVLQNHYKNATTRKLPKFIIELANNIRRPLERTTRALTYMLDSGVAWVSGYTYNSSNRDDASVTPSDHILDFDTFDDFLAKADDIFTVADLSSLPSVKPGIVFPNGNQQIDKGASPDSALTGLLEQVKGGTRAFGPDTQSADEIARFQSTAKALRHLFNMGYIQYSKPLYESQSSNRWCVQVAVGDLTFEGERYLAGIRNQEQVGPSNPIDQSIMHSARKPQTDPKKVFVVHGRDDRARDAMFAFLRALGLRPIEWSEAVQMTAKASPYIGEILERAFAEAMAVVVLFTGDDEARLRQAYRKGDDEIHEAALTPQARANVLFEAGLAFGIHPQRTILVEIGRLRPFSDIGGRHVVRLDNTSQKRQELAMRLQTAGCDVNMAGTDWHTQETFELEPATIEDPNDDPVESSLTTAQRAALLHLKIALDSGVEGIHTMVLEQQIVDGTHAPFSKIRFDLNNLKLRGLIRLEDADISGYLYLLTHDGLALALELPAR